MDGSFTSAFNSYTILNSIWEAVRWVVKRERKTSSHSVKQFVDGNGSHGVVGLAEGNETASQKALLGFARKDSVCDIGDEKLEALEANFIGARNLDQSPGPP